MHSWARYLLNEAQEQLQNSYQLQQYHQQQEAQDTHRDQDIEYGAADIIIHNAAKEDNNNSNQRGGRRIGSESNHDIINSIEEEEDQMPLLTQGDKEDILSSSSSSAAPIRHSFESSYIPSSSSSIPTSNKQKANKAAVSNRPFSLYRDLHPAIRDHIFRYLCDLPSLTSAAITLLPSSISLQFVPLIPDIATRNFLTDCCYSQASTISLYMLTHICIKPLLSLCVSHTNVNGLLGTGQMFLLSTQQFQYLYKHSLISQKNTTGPSSHLISVAPPVSLPPADFSVSYGRLLDVGAGSGAVTTYISPLFSHTVVTEVSWAMCRLLRQASYTVYQSDSLDSLPSSDRFDVICCFNVLDRCMMPLTLLSSLYRRLSDSLTARLFLATPLPLDPWVEVGKKWLIPSEQIAALHCCDCWELAVVKLSLVFMHAGFRVLSVTRLPYLSQGNQHKPFFVLDDALFVLAK